MVTSSQTGSELEDSIAKIRGNWTDLQDKISKMKGQVEAIHRTSDEVAVASGGNIAGARILYKSYARAQEAEDLGRLIDTLLAPSSSVTVSLVVLLVSSLFCLLF